MTLPFDPTRRFSDRVADYVAHRPTYPRELLLKLGQALELEPASVVADVGSGTGIFTRLLLEQGYQVRAVEPNREMREAAERLLAGFKAFTSIASTAEATELPENSVDLITCAQAFHWFDTDRARAEFLRISKPPGRVALIWNARRESGDAFHEDYERLLREHGVDYEKVRHQGARKLAAIDRFFGDRGYETIACANSQRLDFEGLKGRLLSSSYAPASGKPGHEGMIAALETLFSRHQSEGLVTLEYETAAKFGRLL